MNRLRRIIMDLALQVDAWAFNWLAGDPDSSISWRDHLRWLIEDRAMALWAIGYHGSQEELDDALQLDWEYLNARQREHYRASTWSLELYRGAR